MEIILSEHVPQVKPKQASKADPAQGHFEKGTNSPMEAGLFHERLQSWLHTSTE